MVQRFVFHAGLENESRKRLKMLRYIKTRLSALIIGFAAVFGVFITDDYGMSWDEAMQRFDNGKPVYEYVVEGNPDIYLSPDNNEKYHGAWFEFVLYGIEKTFKLTDNRSVYLMRHYLNYLLFCLGAWWFMLACKRLFAENWVVLTGVVMYFLSPRLFADAFYNSKDIPFFVFYIGYMWTLLRFRDKQTSSNLALHGAVTGLLIGLRVSGIIVVPLTLFVIIALGFQASSDLKCYVKRVFIYIGISAAALYICWPILWQQPFKQFTNAYIEMSHYHWQGMMIFEGKMIHSSVLPWYYLPKWIALTTPILYLIAGIAGIGFLLFEIARSPSALFRKPEFPVIIALFFGPLLAVIFLHSTVYDGWRHLYFVYAPLLLLAVTGIDRTKQLLVRYKYGPIAGVVVLLIGITPVFVRMVKDHPHEMVYFNRAAGSSLNEIRFNYEMDYWGLSFREAIEYVAGHDHRPLIKYHSGDFPGRLTYEIMPEGIKSRMKPVEDWESPDYFIGDYRSMMKEYECADEFYRVKVDGATICIVCRLTR